jgi:hypothetical protein
MTQKWRMIPADGAEMPHDGAFLRRRVRSNLRRAVVLRA